MIIKAAVLFLVLMVAFGLWGTWRRVRPPAHCGRCGALLKGARRCPSCGARA